MGELSFLELEDKSKTVRSKSPGAEGSLPLNEEMLLNSPSGDLFGLSLNVGMGWDPRYLEGGQVLILSTSGGLRNEDGTPIALGYHTGHWELNLLVREAARTLKDAGQIPFAAFCSDPCDGRSQGTDGMMDSLAWRNTGAEAFGRLIRSLPTRRAVVGIATCDKGAPAMMMALAEAHTLPGIFIPGGVTLPPIEGEDAGTIQSISTRFAHGEISIEDAAMLGCKACASPGGGCQFLGTAATAQVVAEALGMSIPHSALCPSGESIWMQLGRDSAKALETLQAEKITMGDILSKGAFQNAMAVHSAIGGSTNLLLHIPAIAYNAGVERPGVDDWIEINSKVSRIVDALPNGPQNFKTVQFYLAGGTPEVMLHLREQGLLDLNCLTASSKTVGDNLEWWENSDRRRYLRELLTEQDGADPNDVIMAPHVAASRGLTSTVIFPTGNIAPDGSVVKSTAIDAALCPNDVYEITGAARVFTSEADAIVCLKRTSEDQIRAGDVIVLICRGPEGAGLPETSQLTMALKYTDALSDIPLITDGRFSGFSSGPCIGHVGPEALAGGPIGKIQEGDRINIHIDRKKLRGSINVLGSKDCAESSLSPAHGASILAEREIPKTLQPDPSLPDATRLWAALQRLGGGAWGGCVYDVDKILEALDAGKASTKASTQ